jgi:hypothetical protein
LDRERHGSDDGSAQVRFLKAAATTRSRVSFPSIRVHGKEVSFANSPIEVRHACGLCTSSFQGEFNSSNSFFTLDLTVPHALQRLSSMLIPTSGQEPSRRFGHKDPDCATRGTNEN